MSAVRSPEVQRTGLSHCQDFLAVATGDVSARCFRSPIATGEFVIEDAGHQMIGAQGLADTVKLPAGRDNGRDGCRELKGHVVENESDKNPLRYNPSPGVHTFSPRSVILAESIRCVARVLISSLELLYSRPSDVDSARTIKREEERNTLQEATALMERVCKT